MESQSITFNMLFKRQGGVIFGPTCSAHDQPHLLDSQTYVQTDGQKNAKRLQLATVILRLYYSIRFAVRVNEAVMFHDCLYQL